MRESKNIITQKQTNMLRNLLTLLITLAFCQSSHSQVVFNSLDDVWKYADAHNITIRIAKNELEKAHYAKNQSYGVQLPQANATGSYTDNIVRQTTLLPGEMLKQPPGTYAPVQFGTQFAYTGGLNAQMSIFNLQNWYNSLVAKQTEEITHDSLANQRKSVYQQIATQFYSYLLMQEAARLANVSSNIADSVYQSANNKFKEGTINAANLDIAKLNFERAQLNLVSATYQMVIARNNLKGLLGMSLTDSLTIEATLQDKNSIDPLAAFTEDPSLRIALLRTKISLSQLKAANSAFAPTVNVLYNYSTQRYDNTYEPFSKATGTTAWFPAQYWSLQASLPIFTGGTRFYQSKRNKITWKESTEQYEYIQQQSAINDENIRLNYRKAAAVLTKSENIMSLSFDNYTHVSNRYESGLASLDDRLNAFKDYIDYQNQYLNSLSDLLVQMYQVKIRQQSF